MKPVSVRSCARNGRQWPCSTGLESTNQRMANPVATDRICQRQLFETNPLLASGAPATNQLSGAISTNNTTVASGLIPPTLSSVSVIALASSAFFSGLRPGKSSTFTIGILATSMIHWPGIGDAITALERIGRIHHQLLGADDPGATRQDRPDCQHAVDLTLFIDAAMELAVEQ